MITPRLVLPYLLLAILVLALGTMALAPAAGANPIAPSFTFCDTQGRVFDAYVFAVGPIGTAPTGWFASQRCQIAPPVDEIAASAWDAPLFAQTGHESGAYTLYSGALWGSCDPQTAPVPDGLSITGLEYGAGVLYAVVGPRACGAGWLYSFDPGTSSFAPIGPTGMHSLRGLVWDATSASLYSLAYGPAVCDESGVPALVRIDPVTGAATLVGSTGAHNLVSLAFASEFLVGGSSDLDGGNLYVIDRSTGAATLVRRNFEGIPTDIRGIACSGSVTVPARKPSWGQLKTLYR